MRTAPTTPARRLGRVLSAAVQPMTLRGETVRPTVAFDRKLNRVQPYTLLSVPR